MLPGNQLTNTQVTLELLHKTIMNQAYLITIMKAQAQLIANTELTTADSVFRDMNEQASQLVTSLYQVMEEKYK